MLGDIYTLDQAVRDMRESIEKLAKVLEGLKTVEHSEDFQVIVQTQVKSMADLLLKLMTFRDEMRRVVLEEEDQFPQGWVKGWQNEKTDG